MWAVTRGTTTAEPQHSGSIPRPTAWCLGDQVCVYPSSCRQRINGPRRRPLGREGAQATSGKSPDFSEPGPEGSRRLESQRAESEASREAPAGGRGAAAARGSESGALTVRYVRLSATTSFAWFWCGCCASLKASLIESSLFSAPMVPGLRGNEPRLRPGATGPTDHRLNHQRLPRLGSAGYREPGAWLPPEHLNNSRGRRKHRETAARGPGGQSGKRRTHPPPAPRLGRMRLGPSRPFSGWEVAFLRGGDSLLARKWYPLRG